MKHLTKKGVSPLIATVIIIGFTIVLAALLITFGTQFFKGQIAQQEKTSAISTICSTGLANLDVKASAVTNGVEVLIDNKNDYYLWGYTIRAYDSAKKPIGSKGAAFTASRTAPVIKKFEASTQTIAATDLSSGKALTDVNSVGVLVQVSPCKSDANGKCTPADLKENPPTFCGNEIKADVF